MLAHCRCLVSTIKVHFYLGVYIHVTGLEELLMLIDQTGLDSISCHCVVLYLIFDVNSIQNIVFTAS